MSRDGSFEAYVRRALFTTYAGWRGPALARRGADRASSRRSAVTTRRPDPDLLRALDGLSARQRAVVVLRYFEDLTEAEAATVLGCSVGSVKTHHSRALAALRSSPLLVETTLTEEAR